MQRPELSADGIAVVGEPELANEGRTTGWVRGVGVHVCSCRHAEA
jgi:hypothetical protein